MAKPALQMVDHMLEPPTVGSFYLVPSIHYRMFDDKEDAWYPTFGPPHEDAEHLRFPWQHFHPDWRFVTARVFNRATKNSYGEQGIFGYPLHLRDLPLPTKTEYRRMKCRRTIPENVVFRGLPNAAGHFLAWSGVDAKRGPRGFVCPHRGAILGSAAPNADGTVTCPLHGLRFCAKSGKSVPVILPV